MDSIFARVCDNGSNMKKALEVLKGLFCSAHTLERSVLVYTESPGVKETIGRTKAITSFFHRSPLAMAEMLKIQVTNRNPDTLYQHLVYVTCDLKCTLQRMERPSVSVRVYTMIELLSIVPCACTHACMKTCMHRDSILKGEQC